MTPGWTLFIIIVTAVNIVGAVWLLWATSRASPEEDKPGAETGHVWDGDLREYHNPLPRWWLWLFYGTVVFSIGYMVMYPGLGGFGGTLGWTQERQWREQVAAAEQAAAPVYARFAGMDLEQLAADEDALRVGRNLFANNCAMCHGADGGGRPGFPSLTDTDWLWGGDPASIEMTISQGRIAAMPPWEAQLGARGVEEAAAYVLALAGREAPADMAAAGKAHFDLFCTACHGPDGKGNTALGAPNLTDNVWLYGSAPDVLRTTIAKGRNNQMPAQKDLLGEPKVRLLTAYVMSMSPRVAVAPAPAAAAPDAAAQAEPDVAAQ